MALTKVTSDVIANGAITGSHLTNITTAHVTEGSNLYHTSARARSSISATGIGITYDSSTGVIQGSAPTIAQTLTAGHVIPDNQQLHFGTSNDLRIYHDGSHSRILENGTGNLIIQGTNLDLADTTSGDTFLRATSNSSVELYYDGSKKLETTNTGVKFTGNLVADDNQSIILGTSNDLRIKHDGTHSYISDEGTGNLNLKTNGVGVVILDPNDNNLAVFNGGNGITTLYHVNSGTSTHRIQTSSTGASINGTLEVSGDLNITGDINSVSVTDLDVSDKTITLGVGQTESASGGSGIIVDGSGAFIKWDEGNTEWDFNAAIRVTGNVRSNNVQLFEGTTQTGGIFKEKSVTGTGTNTDTTIFTESGGGVNFMVNGSATKVLVVESGGDVVVKGGNLEIENGGELRTYRPTGGNSYFRIKMDAGEKVRFYNSWNANEFVYDRDGKFGIGTAAPAAKLHIQGNSDNGDEDCMLIIEDTDGSAGSRIPAIMFRSFTSNTVTNQGRIRGTGTQGMILSGSSALGDDLVVQASGVGIGTTSISHKLEVNGTARFQGAITSVLSSSGGAFLSITHTGNESWSFDARSGSGSMDYVDFGIGGGTRAMTWQENGYVGIGRNDPGVELDIKRTTNAYPLRIGSSQGEGRAIVFADVHASPNKYNWITGSQYNVNDSFEITPSSATGGYTFNDPSMVFKPDGQVLINKTGSDVGASTNILEIDGNIRQSGGNYGLKLNNGSVERWAYRLTSSNNVQLGHDKIIVESGGEVYLAQSTAASGKATFSTGPYASGQGDNKTHFGYNTGSGYYNYLRGTNTVVSGLFQADLGARMKGNIHFGEDSSNPGSILIADNSTTAYYLQITGTGTRTYKIEGGASGADYTTTFNNAGTGEHDVVVNGNFQVNSTATGAITIQGNNGGLNFSTGTNQRIYFGSQRALEGNSGSNVLQFGEGFSSGFYQMSSNVFYGHVTPSTTNTFDLGSSTHVWRDLYIGDLNLNNETRVNDDGTTGNEIDGTTGNWTIQEGEEHLYIINNKNGKKYKFALEEIE